MNSEMVREFHEKHDIPTNTRLPKTCHVELEEIALVIRGLARHLEDEYEASLDDRLFRAHLMCEELSECLYAMARGDEVLLLDGLADLEYVTEGCALAFGLPLQAAFVEVHKSNMTKELSGIRCRNKGVAYVPPDIKGVLEAR